MEPVIETEKGWDEVVIVENCGFDTFHAVAGLLESAFGIVFTHELNDFDTVYLNFDYKDTGLYLYYNIYLGIRIFPRAFKEAAKSENDHAREIGTLLFRKLQKK